MPFAIAIDGPAAAGKGTIARAVAAHFQYPHLDTGLLYRAVGRKMMDGIDPIEAALTLSEDDLARDDLRTADVAQAASKVAVIAEVRAALLDFQRAFAARAGGAVLDGRDIGTVICPDAPAKLFVTASAEARAERRHKQLMEKGVAASLRDLFESIRERDARDMARSASPLKPADDALVLDTTELDADAVYEVVLAQVRERGLASGT